MSIVKAFNLLNDDDNIHQETVINVVNFLRENIYSDPVAEVFINVQSLFNEKWLKSEKNYLKKIIEQFFPPDGFCWEFYESKLIKEDGEYCNGAPDCSQIIFVKLLTKKEEKN